MFEDYTYERLLEDVLSNAPKGIDTRQGSIFYDAVSGPLLKIAKLYTDLDLIVEMMSIATATGKALDLRASEQGVFRLAATRAKYLVTFEGVMPQTGERFYTNGQYFVLRSREESGQLIYYLEAEAAGIGGNDIYISTPAIPVNNIEGLFPLRSGRSMKMVAMRKTMKAFASVCRRKSRDRLRTGISSIIKHGARALTG